jgi:hypothetical protein
MLHRLFLASVLALAGCFVVSLGASAETDDPAAVLQGFQDAQNRGDVEGAMALVASDVSFVGGSACPSDNPCQGTDNMRRALRVFAADHVYSATLGTPEVSGSVVRARLAFQSDSRAAIGIDRTLSDVTVVVRDGQLIEYLGTNDRSDPQTAWWVDHQPVL